MHGHQHKHLARARRDLPSLQVREDHHSNNDGSSLQAKAAAKDDPNPDVATIVSVVYVTAAATFTGPTAGFVTLGADSTTSAVAAAATQTTTQDEETTTHTSATAVKATSVSSAQTTKSSTASTSSASVKSASSTVSATSPTRILTTSSSVVISSTTLATSSASHTGAHSSSKVLSGTALAEASSTSSASASATAAPSAGLSSGAKGGIAFAILLLLGLVGGLVFFCVRRKKEQQKNQRGLQRLEDEKSAIHRRRSLTPPAAPNIQSLQSRSASPAPRLSVRPTSQFSPNLAGDVEKGAGVVAAGAAVGQKNSAWESRPSTNAGTDPANPFGIHAQTVNAQSTDKLAAGASTTTLKPFIELPGSPVPSPLKSNPTSPAHERSNPMASPSKAEFGTAAAVPVVAAVGPRLSPPANNVHRVQLDFKPSMDDELELRAGDIVRMLHEYDDGWALCVRMDQSKQGVAPRTCLSKLPLKPRPVGPPPANMRSGPPPQGHRNFSGPAASRNLGPNSIVPAPLSTNVNGRPASPATGSPKIQQGPRQRARTVSNAAAQTQLQARAMSPAPTPSEPVGDEARPRSNSVGQAVANASVGAGPLNTNVPTVGVAIAPESPTVASVPARKPVPGQAL
ncbi:hypothetical protein MBLNU459_g2732t1 [Dothideomycetes sp. NU459]